MVRWRGGMDTVTGEGRANYASATAGVGTTAGPQPSADREPPGRTSINSALTSMADLYPTNSADARAPGASPTHRDTQIRGEYTHAHTHTHTHATHNTRCHTHTHAHTQTHTHTHTHEPHNATCLSPGHTAGGRAAQPRTSSSQTRTHTRFKLAQSAAHPDAGVRTTHRLLKPPALPNRSYRLE